MPRQTYNEDKMEEYAKRTLTYADYMISEMKKGNKVSVRGVAKEFSNHPNPDLAKSHVTIFKTLVEVLPNIDIIKYVTIKNILENNKAKSIEDNIVRARVLYAVKLLLNDYNINEIVDIMNKELDENNQVTFNTIYRDLTERLYRLDNINDLGEIVENVSAKLKEHSENNLKKSNVR